MGRSRRSRRVAGGGPRQHEGVLRRDDRQSRRQRARHRSDRRDRARARLAADRRQHVRHAVSLPPDRVGRRHRRCTRRRSSSAATARASAASSSIRGTFNWSNGRYPVDRRSVAGLSRSAVPRDVRHVRLSDEAARRDAARSRRVHEPVQRVSVPAGTRDAVAADGASRGECRARWRAISSRTSSRRT